MLPNLQPSRPAARTSGAAGGSF